METRFLKLPSVIEATGLSRSQVYKLIQQGEFPPPIKLGDRAVAWDERSITAWQIKILSRVLPTKR